MLLARSIQVAGLSSLAQPYLSVPSLPKIILPSVSATAQGRIITEYDLNGAVSGKIEVNKLHNGVTAVAVDNGRATAQLGLYSGVGTRQQTQDTVGIMQIMKHTMLSTTTRRSFVWAHRVMAFHGADIKMNVARDHTAITATCTREKEWLVLDHMCQNIICPEFFEHELMRAKTLALQETSGALANPDNVLLEEAHRIAYRGGLGTPLYAAPNSIARHGRDEVLGFWEQHFRKCNSTVLVGIGLDIETVSGLGDEFLWSLEGRRLETPGTESWSGSQHSHIEAAGNTTRALYLIQGAATGTREALLLNLIKHVVGVSSSPAVYGGELNTKLMSAADHAQKAHSVHCLNINYSDTGLFGLSVAADSQEVGDVLHSSIGVMGSLKSGISDEELDAAKNKLKLEIVTQREESLMGLVGLDGLLSISPSTTAQALATVDSITSGELAGMAKAIAKSSPILVSHGNEERIPDLKDLL